MPPEGRPRPVEADHPGEVGGGSSPVQLELGGGELRRVGRLPGLGTRVGQARDACGQDLHQQRGADVDQLRPQLAHVLAGGDLHPARGVDRPGVEPFFDLHHAHAGDVVTAEDGPLERGSSAPAGQEREVEVHHGHPTEDLGGDQTSVGDDDTQLGAPLGGGAHVAEVVGHREGQLECSCFDRARRGEHPSPPPPVGSGHHLHHLVPGVDQGPQRPDGELGGAQVDEAHRIDRPSAGQCAGGRGSRHMVHSGGPPASLTSPVTSNPCRR